MGNSIYFIITDESYLQVVAGGVVILAVSGSRFTRIINGEGGKFTPPSDAVAHPHNLVRSVTGKGIAIISTIRSLRFIDTHIPCKNKRKYSTNKRLNHIKSGFDDKSDIALF